MTNDLFILLKAGMWQKAEGFSLSDAPDWEVIYTLANQQAVIGLRSKDIRNVVLNLAKFGASLFILPFTSMKKRVAARGRKAMEEEEKEFESCAGMTYNNFTS